MDDQMEDQEAPSMGIRGLLGLGSMLVGAMVFFTLLGWVADSAFDTSPVLTLAGVGLGILVGLGGGWLQIRKFLA
jgi:Putative F0F1-ATPase subunit Ca2+/Mg2+ transporter